MERLFLGREEGNLFRKWGIWGSGELGKEGRRQSFRRGGVRDGVESSAREFMYPAVSGGGEYVGLYVPASKPVPFCVCMSPANDVNVLCTLFKQPVTEPMNWGHLCLVNITAMSKSSRMSQQTLQ